MHVMMYKNAAVPKNWCFRRNWCKKPSASKEWELCHYWFFEDVGFKLKKHVCNGCHDFLTMAYSLKNIPILRAKGVTFSCILMDISKNEGLKRLNYSVTYDRGVL